MSLPLILGVGAALWLFVLVLGVCLCKAAAAGDAQLKASHEDGFYEQRTRLP